MPHRLSKPRAGFLALLATLALVTHAGAGGGPANVLLVVNANSAGSKRVANHYAWLRRLPPSNVLYLDYKGPPDSVDGLLFQKEILRPILEAINGRRLSPQIDTVAYSTDFPWRVNLAPIFDKEQKFSPKNRPAASLTGATYLYSYVLAKSPVLVALRSNFYRPIPPGLGINANLAACRSVAEAPSRAFRSRYAWHPSGERAPDLKSGVRYLMSTVLGVTRKTGNTVDEVIACLDRAAEADFTAPSGGFYFMRRERAVRSKPRHECFAGVVDQLRELGSEAYVEEGVVPKGPAEVAGLMTGASIVSIDSSKLRLQPGAIVEHLTSFGGAFAGYHSQTTMCDLIRSGATGSSGTVYEPYAIQAKFPDPSLQLHYRRGCSLAEAFYQSVASPYQLLVLGDPLCQPWAERPGLDYDGWPSVSGIDPTPVVTATDKKTIALEFTPRVEPAGATTTKGVWELYIDGRLRVRSRSTGKVALTAANLGPGWHGLQLVGVDTGPIECQREVAGAIEVLGEAVGLLEGVRLKASIVRLEGGGEQVVVSAEAPGAERIVVRQHSRQVAEIQGDSGEARLEASVLGGGRVRLQAFAEPSGAASPPVWVRVE